MRVDEENIEVGRKNVADELTDIRVELRDEEVVPRKGKDKKRNTETMKKITKEEAEKLQTKLGSSTVVRTEVTFMKVGEVLIIEKRDWTQKKGPGQMLQRVTEKTKQRYTLKTLADESGWLVERIE